MIARPLDAAAEPGIEQVAQAVSKQIQPTSNPSKIILGFKPSWSNSKGVNEHGEPEDVDDHEHYSRA